MVHDAIIFTCVLLLLAIVIGFCFASWFHKFRFIPVILYSIGFSILTWVAFLMNFNSGLTLCVVLLQFASLFFMFATAAAKLLPRLKFYRQAA